ncbi:hypothetical protein TSOC_000022 [Tetrabaena socialis]|uniref:BACK domain-containing protein n=1 Tax=Tetrabaena socialis TaxID=47790 RepID=A0A2J8AKH8_9CHLO|nr:hypothetical protein TSOC_000022 [Tetrabaena socialis]|eukprot:PNH13017.1 hypothetical protein TSOC_000022 [Tetrabaena socialis]
MYSGNSLLAKAIADKFGSAEGSDCAIVFYVAGRDSGEVGEDGIKDEATGTAQKARKVERAVGDPLPGHKFVLRCISEWFRAKIDRWDGAGSAGGSTGSPTASGPVELRVSLNKETDAPSARAAIGVGYTGRVQADSMREVLRIRCQGAYLQVDGCAAACDEFITARLQAENGSSSSGAGVDAQDGGPQPPVLEFFSAFKLFPADEPSFAALLASAKQALVRHFRDTLVVLNTPALKKQFLALPAVAVEALLESEDFATDAESSVLLLLAAWAEGNKRTKSTARERLCRLVRLVQLGRAYLTFVLPALAADFEAGADEDLPSAWFPISCMEAAFLASLSSAGSSEQRELREAGGSMYRSASPAYSGAARPQCVPGGGLTFDWSIGEQELQLALQALRPGQTSYLYGVFAGGVPSISASGLEWRPKIALMTGLKNAGVYLECSLPTEYDVEGSRMATTAVGVTRLHSQLTVHRWNNGVRNNAYAVIFKQGTGLFRLWGALGNPSALSLRAPPATGEAHPNPSLAAWADYLHGGKITGSFKLLPPPAV